MTFLEVLTLAKEAVLLLFFAVFVATAVNAWLNVGCEAQRLLPLKENHGDSQA